MTTHPTPIVVTMSGEEVDQNFISCIWTILALEMLRKKGYIKDCGLAVDVEYLITAINIGHVLDLRRPTRDEMEEAMHALGAKEDFIAHVCPLIELLVAEEKSKGKLQ